MGDYVLLKNETLVATNANGEVMLGDYIQPSPSPSVTPSISISRTPTPSISVTPSITPSITPSVSPSPINLSSNMIGLWRFEDDVTEAINGYTTIATSGVTYETGIHNKSARLDATDDKIYVNSNTVFDFERTDAFSFSFWAKRPAAATNQSFVQKIGGSKGYNISITSLIGLPRIFTEIMESVATEICTYTPDITNIITGFTHIVVTYNGNSEPSGIKTYINGTEQSVTGNTRTLTSTIKNTGVFRIASGPSNVNGNLYIDELYVFDKVLSPTEISYLYNSGSGRFY